MMWPMLTGFETDMDPFGELTRLQGTMNRLFRDYACRGCDFPLINVWANDAGCVVTAEIPGIDPKGLSLHVTGNLLTLEGERKADDVADQAEYHRRERGYGRFARSVRLPFDVDGGAAKAGYSRGVLRIALPRKESAKPRTITVESE